MIPIRTEITPKALIILAPSEKRKAYCVAYILLVEAILVFGGGLTILQCFWKPESASNYYLDTLSRKMYLYDKEACALEKNKVQSINELDFDLENITKHFNVIALQKEVAVISASRRPAAKTRTFIKLSMALHLIWMLISFIFTFVVRHSIDANVVKHALNIFFFYFLLMITFDISMALVYTAHIQQSLTVGMLLRHAGYTTKNVTGSGMGTHDFAGWIPLFGCAAWLRGIVIFIANIYLCSIIGKIRKRKFTREVQRRIPKIANLYIPGADIKQYYGDDVLHIRTGDHSLYRAELLY